MLVLLMTESGAGSRFLNTLCLNFVVMCSVWHLVNLCCAKPSWLSALSIFVAMHVSTSFASSSVSCMRCGFTLLHTTLCRHVLQCIVVSVADPMRNVS